MSRYRPVGAKQSRQDHRWLWKASRAVIHASEAVAAVATWRTVTSVSDAATRSALTCLFAGRQCGPDRVRFGATWSAVTTWIGSKRHPWHFAQSSISRRNLSCSRSSLASSRSSNLIPPFQALHDAAALPSALRGPVLSSQGRHRRISSACRARRSGVQPFAMLHLQ